MDDKTTLELNNKLGEKWELFKKVHRLILSLDKRIDFCVFPIYIRYSLKEKNIALIYFKGKFVVDAGLDVGLNLKERPKIKGFINAKYMKYPGITYSIGLRKIKDFSSGVIKTIRSIKT